MNAPTNPPQYSIEDNKRIVDVASGGRMFWFDKKNPDVLFLDKRVMQPEVVGHGINARTRSCLPDRVMDFRKLDLPDNSFYMVVFDPPHFFAGKNSYTAKQYGSLDKETWQDDLTKGFAECFRVLKPNGTLIFKWNEFMVPLKEVLKLTPEKPLFGHPSGKAQLTHWLTFMKADDAVSDLAGTNDKANTDVTNPPELNQLIYTQVLELMPSTDILESVVIPPQDSHKEHTAFQRGMYFGSFMFAQELEKAIKAKYIGASE